MLEVGTMLILAGCLFYSLFNALFFAYVYYRRRRLEEEEEIIGDPGTPREFFTPLQVQKGLQIVPLAKPLTHNAWLHEVAMKHLCTTNKLVGIKETKPPPSYYGSRSKPTGILSGDILLRIRNLYGPFTDIKLVNRFFHRNRKFDTPVLVYRYDPETAQGEIVDLMIKPSEDLVDTSFGMLHVQTDKFLKEIYKPKEKKKEKDQVSVLYKHQVSDEVEETFENTCGICFDNFPNAILQPCGHRICVNCHNMLYVKSCPYCRKPIEQCKYELLV